MGLFDNLNIFGKKKPEKPQQTAKKKSDLTFDQIFVKHFKENGGKFLYTDSPSEVLVFLRNIMSENAWENLNCFDDELLSKLNIADITVNPHSSIFFTKCEHLIADEGSILFSSNQLKEVKLTQYPLDFIVYATTSQLRTNKDQALTSIKFRYKSNIPTNISAVKDYQPDKIDSNFLNYGNANSKNLYLLLFEDL